MAYDWKSQSEQKGQARAERIPVGTHQVEIVKLVFGKKDGTLFKSKGGDPQMMLIFKDDQDREAADIVTLSDKAAWKLAGILAAAGANVEKMTASGITPDRFTDEKFATANLVGRMLTVEVTYQGEYTRVSPVLQQPASTAAAGGFDPENDIPF